MSDPNVNGFLLDPSTLPEPIRGYPHPEDPPCAESLARWDAVLAAARAAGTVVHVLEHAASVAKSLGKTRRWDSIDWGGATAAMCLGDEHEIRHVLWAWDTVPVEWAAEVGDSTSMPMWLVLAHEVGHTVAGLGECAAVGFVRSLVAAVWPDRDVDAMLLADYRTNGTREEIARVPDPTFKIDPHMIEAARTAYAQHLLDRADPG